MLFMCIVPAFIGALLTEVCSGLFKSNLLETSDKQRELTNNSSVCLLSTSRVRDVLAK